MTDIASLGVEVKTKDLDNLNQALKETTSNAGKAENAVSKFGASASVGSAAAKEAAGGLSMVTKGFIALGAAAVTAGLALVKAFNPSQYISATKEVEDVQAQLAAAITATGEAAGRTIDQLNDQAAAMQKVTRFSDEAIGSAQAVMLNFTNVRGEVFDRSIEAAADLAAKWGTDIPSAARALGRALEDPIRGMNTLRRQGVVLTDEQKKNVETLVQQNRGIEAQGILLSALETRLKGVAEAQRRTLGGTVDALRNQWGDLFEMGPSATQPLKQALDDIIKAFTHPAFKQFAQDFGSMVFQGLTLAARGVESLIINFRGLTQWLGVTSREYDSVTGKTIKLTEANAGLIGSIISTNDKLRQASPMWDHMNGLFDRALYWIGRIGAFLADVVGTKLQNTWEGILSLTNTIVSSSAAVSAGMAEFGRQIMMIGDTFPNTMNAIKNAFSNFMQWLGDQLAGSSNIFLAKLGRDLFATFKSRVYAEGPSLVDAAVAIGKAFSDGFENSFFNQWMQQRALAKITGFSAAVQKSFDAANQQNLGNDRPGLQNTPSITPPPFNFPKGDAGGDKTDPFKEAVKSAQQYIASQKQIADALGQTALQAATAKNQLDLLNKAKAEDGKLTREQKIELEQWAAKMANQEVLTERLKFMDAFNKESEKAIANARIEEAALFMGTTAAVAYRIEQEKILQAKQAKVSLGDADVAQIRATAQAQAEAVQRFEQQKMVMDSAREIWKGFWNDLREGINNGVSLWDTFANAAVNALNRIAEKLLDMAMSKLWDAAFGGAAAGGGSGFLGPVIKSVVSGIGAFFGGGGVGLDMFSGTGMTYAEGGRYGAGEPRIVGEKGWELDVPDRAGTIYNQDQLSSMLGGGSGDGGVHVTVVQNNQFDATVSRAEMFAMGRQIEKNAREGAIAGVMEKRQRGGPMKQVFNGRKG